MFPIFLRLLSAAMLSIETSRGAVLSRTAASRFPIPGSFVFEGPSWDCCDTDGSRLRLWGFPLEPRHKSRSTAYGCVPRFRASRPRERLKITSTEPVKLISVATPAANINEIHEMKMEAGVMKMRAHLGGLDIPARKVVELKSSGYHVMMMDLTQTIKPGQTVPLELQFADAKGLKRTVLVNAKTSFADPYPK